MSQIFPTPQVEFLQCKEETSSTPWISITLNTFKIMLHFSLWHPEGMYTEKGGVAERIALRPTPFYKHVSNRTCTNCQLIRNEWFQGEVSVS